MDITRTSYNKEDVVLLLKDITGMIVEKPTDEREKLIQSGVHYSEMLPIEYEPGEEYNRLYKLALEKYGEKVYKAVAITAEKILLAKGKDVVLVSLARAGTPIGILIKKYLKFVYNFDVPHYTMSIIRGKGLDSNAMKFLLSKYKPVQLQFVDGWTGKGAILNELKSEIRKFNGVSDELAVLADPANICRICGTHEDFLIPSSCLNSTVSGLFSRTVLNDTIIDIDKGDYHGSVYYEKFIDKDMSNSFLNEIVSYFNRKDCCDNYMKAVKEYYEEKNESYNGMSEVIRIKEREDISDINFIKPGIGETTRVLLRRVPWKILVKDIEDKERIGHILELANEKNVCVVEDKSLMRYNCIGIIKNMADT